MTRRPSGRQRPGPWCLPSLSLAVLVLACAGGNAVDVPGADVRTSPLDVHYGDASRDGAAGDVAEGDPGAPGDAPSGVPEAACTGEGCVADDDGAAGPDAAGDVAACTEPADWQCVDASVAHRCVGGQVEARLCGASEVCDLGICMPLCPTGTANCSHDPADGCYVDTTSDPAHCGNCFTNCGDAECVNSLCVCASVSQGATSSPLDMFIMMDQSSSMDETTGSGLSKWDAVSQAIRVFVTDAGSAGIGVGIQYFPIVTGGYFGSESCKVSDYAKAETPIAVLPGNAAKIIASMKAHGDGGNTPTYPALQGAVDFARAHATANPSHTVVVVLATDGEPTECDPQDIPAIAKVASKAAAGTPAILTFVVGVGSSLSSLDEIAAGGGTQKAFIVDQGGNVVQQFAAAMKAIQGQALGCTYAIPAPADGQAINFEKVNVQVALGGGAPSQLAYADTTAACGTAAGWTYDDPAQPNKILLCPATCSAVTGDPKAQVDILLGCWRSGKPPDTHQ